MPNIWTPEAGALIAATFVAAAVEVVEALTIVLAMGLTRGWKATIAGSIVALIALAIITAALGVTLMQCVSQTLLQFFIGTLLLVFGLQWVRKAILRASGLQAIHDEDKIFKKNQEAAMNASHQMRFGLDWFGFVVSCKGVFLEGMEVVFIVLTFGLAAQAKGVPHAIGIATAAAVLAAVLVGTAGAIVRHPLSRVPENAMKFGVGLLLSTFGTFWSVEGLGFFRSSSHNSIEWPMGEWALPILLSVWVVVALVSVAVLRGLTNRQRETAAVAVGGSE